MSTDAAWYETAFERSYLDVYPHRDVPAARAEVAGLVERGLGAVRGRVLDLGCGFGRHALALREAGLDVFGLDLSLDLLVHAGELAGAERLAGRLVRGDFRRLPFAADAFDALTMLFSSFGYFDDRQNARVLAELARVVAPGGTLVLDLMNADRVRATLVPESRAEHAGRVLNERRRLLDGGRRVRKDVELSEADGRVRRWHEDVRLYDSEELSALLAAHALEVVREEGDFDGRPIGAGDVDAPRRIVWARRAGGGAR